MAGDAGCRTSSIQHPASVTLQTKRSVIFAADLAFGKSTVPTNPRPLDALEQTIAERAANPSEKSYTCQLLAGGVEAIGDKIIEEAAEVVGHTGSGNIDLDFVDAPRSVALDAGSGDVSVLLPQGAYAVDVDASSGDEQVDVNDDPGAADHVTVNTGSGDVYVDYLSRRLEPPRGFVEEAESARG